MRDYSGLIKKWNKRINLVSRESEAHLWDRHIKDSAQLFPLIPPKTQTIIDLGSGAGFPGLIIAILAADLLPDLDVTLVDSDQRKSAFLLSASQDLGLETTIKADRVEELTPKPVDIVTARALAPLDRLLRWSHPLLKPDGMCLFLKGQTWRDELTAAEENWNINARPLPSTTNPDAAVLKIEKLTHA